MRTNFEKANVLAEEISMPLKGKPKRLGQYNSISEEFWLWNSYHFLFANYEIVIISYLQWKLKKEVVEVVDLPYIWFKKFRSLPQENLNNWIKVIESHKNSDKEEAIMSYIQWKLEREAFLPYYASFVVQDIIRKSNFWSYCGCVIQKLSKL